MEQALALGGGATGLFELVGNLLSQWFVEIDATHEIAFQILEDEEVRFNEFSRAPLLRSFEWVETLFKLVRNYVVQHGRIRRQEVVELCRLTPDQAYKLLKRLADAGVLKKQRDRKGASYIAG